MHSKPHRNRFRSPSTVATTATFPVTLMRATLGASLLLWAVLTMIAISAGVSEAAAPKGQAGVVRATLDNGLQVVVVPDPIAPVVTTVINYRAGSNEAPDGFPGMAHAQEHMMFRGSPSLSAGQLADITATLGGRFNADTRQTVTQYFSTVPSQDLDVVLHLEALRMRGVLDTPKLWRQERGAIEQEVAQDLSNPEYVLYSRLLTILFKGTPYAHDALGTRPSFDRTSAAMLRQFHDAWYVPNNAVLVIAGDVVPAKVIAAVKRYFGPIPARRLPRRPGIRLGPVTPQTIHMPTDSPYGMVILAFRMPGYHSPNYAASQILSDVLNNQRGRLYNLVVAGKALETGFSLDTLPAAGLGYIVGTFPKGSDPRHLVNDLRGTLKKILKKGFPVDLVTAAKRSELAAEAFQKNAVDDLAMTWSDALTVEGRVSPRDDILAMAKVSPAEVNQVARRYLDADHMVTAILTPQPSGRPSSGKGFGGGESFHLPQVGKVHLPPWAAHALAKLSIPASSVHPEVTVLPNGLKLIVQPEGISRTVSVYGHIDNNPHMQAPKGKEGVDQVLDHLFSYGTRSMDRLTFHKALDDIAADVSAGTDFSLQVLADQFERGTALLADDELHPALPMAAFKMVRKQTAAEVTGLLQSPDYLASRAMKAALYPKNDPSLRRATPQTIAGLSLKDVKAYYHNVFRPDETVIVVIGDITPKRATAVIKKYFGAWRAVGPKPDILLPPVPPNPPHRVSVPDASRVQDRVMLAETVAMTRSTPDYYALRLGDHVLGGGFYATRLYRDLREKRGLVYYVGVGLEAGRSRSVYGVEYACDPSHVAAARAIVEQNLNLMRTQPVSATELRRAKAMLLREIPLQESSLSSIALGFIGRTRLALPLDEPARAARKYAALSAEAVKAAFAKWLRPDSLIQVTQGPAPSH